MPHIALLGDSIFDNGAYVSGGPDVVAQLRAQLPAGWGATLLAVDGAVVGDVARQLRDLPPETTHLVLSVGGNDALGHVELLTRPARVGGEVLGWFADAVDAFESRYRTLMARVVDAGHPLTVCTIYNGNLPADVRRAAAAALAIFNDAISRVAREHNCPVLELRQICAEAADYANPIEPSVRGGEKIARAIVRQVTA